MLDAICDGHFEVLAKRPGMTTWSHSISYNGWKVETIGKGLRRTVRCRQLIDCTGGADIVRTLGLSRLREEERQPGSLRFVLGGYDPPKLDFKDERWEAAWSEERTR